MPIYATFFLGSTKYGQYGNATIFVVIKKLSNFQLSEENFIYTHTYVMLIRMCEEGVGG